MANTIPVAADVEGSTFEDAIVSITLEAVDPDEGTYVGPTFTLNALPAHGTLWVVPSIPGIDGGLAAQPGTPYAADFLDGEAWTKTFYFIPDANWSGTVEFDYTATDSAGDTSAPATATITLQATADAPTVDASVHEQPEAQGTVVFADAPEPNQPPAAQDGSASGNEDTTISGTAVATDPDDIQLTYTLVGENGGAQHGTVTMNPGGTYLYTPNGNFNGTDSFTFRASDDDGAESNVATITVTVAPVDDPTTASDDSGTIGEDTPGTIDVLRNDSDADGRSRCSRSTEPRSPSTIRSRLRTAP